jgi:hypothetical protein
MKLSDENYLQSVDEQLDELLEDCLSSGRAPYTPDYHTFYNRTFVLMKPIFDYYDGESLKGHILNNKVLWDFIIKFASKKQNIFNQLRNVVDYNPEQIKLLEKLKMLLGFFSRHPQSTAELKVFYKLIENQVAYIDDTDPEKRKKLFAEIKNAVTTLGGEEKDFTDVLRLTDMSFSKFPTLTSLHKIKEDIYLKLIEASMQLRIDANPDDLILQSEKRFLDTLHRTREKLHNNEISEDDFFSSYHAFFEEEYKDLDLDFYERLVTSNIVANQVLDRNVIHFLAIGEYLIERLNPNVDHSPVVVEFGKALEVHLLTSIFEKFKNSLVVPFFPPPAPTDRNELSLQKFCNEGWFLTLGNIKHIIEKIDLNDLYATRPVYESFKDFVQNQMGVNTLASLRLHLTQDKIDRYRNDAAHTSRISRITAQEAKLWSYSIINLF